MHNCFCLAGYITLAEDWLLILITPNTSSLSCFCLILDKEYIREIWHVSWKKKTCRLDSFLQNNCITTKAAEIMSQNNWCDRLWNIEVVPEQVQQRFVSLCIPQLQEIFLVFSPCQGFDRQTETGKKCTNVQYTTKLNRVKTGVCFSQQIVAWFISSSSFSTNLQKAVILASFLYLLFTVFIRIKRWSLL